MLQNNFLSDGDMQKIDMDHFDYESSQEISSYPKKSQQRYTGVLKYNDSSSIYGWIVEDYDKVHIHVYSRALCKGDMTQKKLEKLTHESPQMKVSFKLYYYINDN